jgi:sulfur carrier protein
MNITVNGETQAVPDGVTLAELVVARLPSDRGVAAAVDGTVAPRAGWAGFVLREGQAVELLTAVQGG